MAADTSRRRTPLLQHPLIVGVVLAIVGGVVTMVVTRLTRDPPSEAAATCRTQLTDQFTDELRPPWQVGNGGQMSVSGGRLRIVADDGSDVRPDMAGSVTAPGVGRPVRGDFSISTAVRVDPQFSYQGAGLLLYRDDGNYVRLERGFAAVDAVVFEYAEDGRHQKVHGPFEEEGTVSTSATDVELRLERRGSEVTAAWRPTGGAQWRALSGTAPFDGDSTGGVAVLNRSQPPNPDPQQRPLPADFDYVRLGCPGDG